MPPAPPQWLQLALSPSSFLPILPQLSLSLLIFVATDATTVGTVIVVALWLPLPLLFPPFFLLSLLVDCIMCQPQPLLIFDICHLHRLGSCRGHHCCQLYLIIAIAVAAVVVVIAAIDVDVILTAVSPQPMPPLPQQMLGPPQPPPPLSQPPPQLSPLLSLNYCHCLWLLEDSD